jgi:lipopolysaccharide export system protein LptA
MNKLKLLILSILLLILPVSVVAAALEPATQGPIEVVADQLDVDDVDKVLVFSGNAVASQGELTIYADRLTVRYADEQSEITEVTATGSVRIVQEGRVASGDKAQLFRAEEKVVLSGSPKVVDGDNTVEGETITLFLRDKRTIVSGGSTGRVKALFKPQPKAGEEP